MAGIPVKLDGIPHIRCKEFHQLYLDFHTYLDGIPMTLANCKFYFTLITALSSIAMVITCINCTVDNESDVGSCETCFLPFAVYHDGRLMGLKGKTASTITFRCTQHRKCTAKLTLLRSDLSTKSKSPHIAEAHGNAPVYAGLPVPRPPTAAAAKHHAPRANIRVGSGGTKVGFGAHKHLTYAECLEQWPQYCYGFVMKTGNQGKDQVGQPRLWAFYQWLLNRNN